jgi:hypothetical protein
VPGPGADVAASHGVVVVFIGNDDKDRAEDLLLQAWPIGNVYS